MDLRFMKVHMIAELPKVSSRGLELVATQIIDNGDSKIHKYGLRVAIPAGYIGLLLPVPSIIDKIEKVGALGVITPEDINKELTAVFALPDDMIHDYYKEGEVTAIMIVVPSFPYGNLVLGNW